MKKILGIILIVIGIVMTALGLMVKVKGPMSVSFIGGADGPTSVFFAGKLGGLSAVTEIIVGIILLVIGIFIIAGKNKK